MTLNVLIFTLAYLEYNISLAGDMTRSLHVADLPLKARELIRNIHKRVFMTYLRMATNKESNVSHK